MGRRRLKLVWPAIVRPRGGEVAGIGSRGRAGISLRGLAGIGSRGRAGLGSRLLAIAVAGFVLSGCGNSRTPAPQVSAPALPAGFRALNLPGAGASLSVPRNWVLLRSHSNVLLVLDTSGGAVIALWRYPLQGAAPQGAQQLRQDLQRLIASARSRDRSLKVNSSGVTRIAGRPALTLDTVEHIGPGERRVRSTHVFGSSEELVLEEYAPLQYFPTADRSVFVPVLHSLTLASQ